MACAFPLTRACGILGAILEAGELSVGDSVIGMQVIMVIYSVDTLGRKPGLCDSGDATHDGESGEIFGCRSTSLPRGQSHSSILRSPHGCPSHADLFNLPIYHISYSTLLLARPYIYRPARDPNGNGKVETCNGRQPRRQILRLASHLCNLTPDPPNLYSKTLGRDGRGH